LKVTTLVVLWSSLGASALLLVPSGQRWLWFLLLAVGIGVTAHILRLKTLRSS
jgi:hypothetical protein